MNLSNCSYKRDAKFNFVLYCSRSQCIITIRSVHKGIDVESEHSPSSAVLTIADLAGAERERRTGNHVRFLIDVAL
jgi:hypothetical protein